MLAKEVTREYGDRVRFVVEDFGASPLADRFGIDKYPAVFVDQALVARPEDFYAWGGPETGKYLPWKSIEKRRAFQRDLRRLIDLSLSGGVVPSLKAGPTAGGVQALPSAKLVDLDGKSFAFAGMRGRPVLVEFWATWCPLCLDTLTWMKKLDPATVSVVSIAVESERTDVDKLVAKLQPPGRVTMGSSELIGAFGGLPAVPTLVLADREGRIVRTFYGAPPSLHQQIEQELARLR